MDMGSSSAASSMMDMASSTAMSMASSTAMSMSSSSSTSDMDMDMDMGMDMHMYFTTQYKDYPVLFKGLHARTAAQAFGIFVLLFAVAFLIRGVEFTRNYLEQVVWKNPSYVDCHPGETANTHLKQVNTTDKKVGSCCGGEIDKDSDISLRDTSSDQQHHQQIEGVHASGRPSRLPLASSLVRDAIRLILCILPDLFGFALMLAAMTYTLTYFFAVVLGLGIGRFTFERLSDRNNLKPSGSNGAFHCT